MDNMTKADDFFCVNMKEYLVPDSEDGIGEEELKHILSDFSCAKNVDVENFLLKT